MPKYVGKIYRVAYDSRFDFDFEETDDIMPIPKKVLCDFSEKNPGKWLKLGSVSFYENFYTFSKQGEYVFKPYYSTPTDGDVTSGTKPKGSRPVVKVASIVNVNISIIEEFDVQLSWSISRWKSWKD